MIPSRRRLAAWLLASALVLALAVVAGLVVDPSLGSSDRAGVTTSRALGALWGGGDETARLVVWHLRGPRVALAGLVGAALALAGALLQVLLRNPLADPYVLGVSSGGALAAVLALAAGWGWAGGGHPLAAALGSLAAAVVVHRLARTASGALSGERMVLAGVVLSYLLSAGVMWVVALSSAARTQQYLFWLMGSVGATTGGQVAVLAAAVGACAVATLAVVPGLSLLVVSEEHASDSGVPVEALKRATFLIAAVLTGTSVAVAGSIGFVGLVVPHAVRLLAGSDARTAAPVSAVGGAAFLIAADLLSRALGEIPLGVVTATCGAPFFLWLLARRRPA